MQRTIPLTIVLVLGVLFTVQYFIPSKPSQFLYNNALEWEIVIGLPAIVIATDSLIRHHILKIKQRKKEWPFSLVYLGSA
ncbi:MAG: hypothetical protein MUF78_11625, partial [Candidatus Edwardsbacteria bacterium]|nr:hypothetical protein [Candidatus Edwardsbacteria bacterium]